MTVIRSITFPFLDLGIILVTSCHINKSQLVQKECHFDSVQDSTRIKMDNMPNEAQLNLLIFMVCSLVGLFLIYYLFNYYWSSVLSCCCSKKRGSKICLRNASKENLDFLLSGSTYKRFTHELDEDEEIVIWNNLNSKLQKERQEREMIQV